MEAEKNEGGKNLVRRFFELDRKGKEALKTKIAKSGGLVRIFIHPDFKRYSEFESIKEDPDKVARLKEAERTFQRILSSEAKNVPPIFIFESGIDTEVFLQKEKELMATTRNGVYVIRTEFANPHPLSPDYESNYEWMRNRPTDEERTAMWEWVVEEFKEMGIKRIIIGGVELYISREKNALHVGCLGIAIQKLTKGFFNLEVSTLTWPEGRKEMKEANRSHK